MSKQHIFIKFTLGFMIGVIFYDVINHWEMATVGKLIAIGLGILCGGMHYISPSWREGDRSSHVM